MNTLHERGCAESQPQQREQSSRLSQLVSLGLAVLLRLVFDTAALLYPEKVFRADLKNIR